ncbi:MAG: hypothetical protein MZV63_43600 [Marinilabiliales bacterium]|nr:hypothetical protein [Marinilabiliales bacterium]
MFGYIYHPGNREAKAIEQAYQLFLNENALNPSLFSSLRRLENETVAMVADLLHAGEGLCRQPDHRRIGKYSGSRQDGARLGQETQAGNPRAGDNCTCDHTPGILQSPPT